MADHERDPLAPIEIAVTALLTVGLFFISTFGAFALVSLAVSGSTNVTVLGIGEPTCATVSPGTVSWGGSGEGGEGPMGLREDAASSFSTQAEICLQDPTWAQRIAGGLDPIGAGVLGLVGLLLIRRAVRTARRGGLFTPSTAARTRELGWFLLGMSVVFPLVAAAGRGVVLVAAVSDASWTSGLRDIDLSFTMIVVAIGVLTFARVLRQAVPLQEEVDTTV